MDLSIFICNFKGMIEVKDLHAEITLFLKKEFGVEEVHFDNEDEEIREVKIQLKADCDGTKIKASLKEHFGDELRFHSCEMGGILAILIENI